ncbi:hypothetical protein [Bacillus sp. V5-8f]|uniref:hypothetical protein n=1 Tax=Bacillus sp. V5-8f TaxID=2053044 RepID=UPI000C75A8A4|nr:hypothetical protein [Bacillus sp. V5-8f]PLT35767.1 hypothetical protein CUU64_00365 [Bacillus sp. V5-8f]
MYKVKRRALFLIWCVLFGIVSYLFFFMFSPSHKTKTVVDEFYSYEQEGNFGKSWNLLHPYMKEKWPKSTYINDRSHVFLGHFGSETFEYSIQEVEKMNGWRMSKDLPTFKKTYKFEVIQNYNGTYGKFSFLQYVYVVNNKGNYEIVWDYN